jgi:glycosyltransferase involved in cell wall biosynthesis
MKVAYIIPNLGYGGAEREVARVGALLCRAGIRCDIVCLYEEGHLAGHVRKIGGSVIALNLDRHSSFFRRFRLLTRMLKEKSYDIVHVHLVTWAVLAARLAGAKGVFLTEHGLSLYKGRTAILFDRVAACCCDRMIVVARAIMDVRLKKWKIPARKMMYLPNSVDLKRFDFPADRNGMRRKYGIPEDDRLILSVGSLSPVKGHTYLIPGAAKVIAEFSNVTFAVAGGGELQRDLAGQAEEAGISDRFLLLGYRDDVECLLKAADIFVMPSLREGTSIAILEAMAAGVPVVATEVGGNPELIVDRVTGMLVPPRDHEALSGAITRLIRDDALRNRIIQEGRQKVLAEFSEEVNLERLIVLYGGVLDDTH